jgi:DNA recombination protein RmuC
MDWAVLILLAGLITGGIVLAVLLARVIRELRALRAQDPAQGLLFLQNQLDALREQLRASLEGGRLEIDRRLEETNRVVGEVRRGLGAVDHQVRSVSAAARDLRSLQELLRSPKIRGGIGEFLLSDLLGQVLPEANYALQHEFSGGERVDAVLRVGQGLVPVDAKFPLENFQRMRAAEDENVRRDARRAFRNDVKRHVDAIAKRYIRPDEQTFEFAMMYVPAEAVYQEILQQEGDDGLDLFDAALSRRVVPVSPQSFYAYLQVIVLGLRGLSLEGRTREILERLGLIQNRLDRFADSFDITVRHLGNAHRQAEEAGRRLARLESAFTDLSRGSEMTNGAGRVATQKRKDSPA